MAHGLTVYNAQGQEIMSSIKPFNIVRRISVTGGPGTKTITIPNMVSGSSLSIVAGHMGGSADEIIDIGGGGNISLGSFSQNGSEVTFTMTLSAGTLSPDTLHYTILARR